MFKYICFQTKSYNFQVTSYNKGIYSIYETDFNQFYTIWDGSKYLFLFILPVVHGGTHP